VVFKKNYLTFLKSPKKQKATAEPKAVVSIETKYFFKRGF